MRNKKGLTLLELLMTTLLLGIGLTGVGGMFTAGVVSSRKAAYITTAAHRANKEIERIRDGGFLGAQVDYIHFPYPDYYGASGNRAYFNVSELPGGTGQVEVDMDPEAQVVNPDTGLYVDNLKKVRVLISWGGARNLRGSYSVSTLLANRP